MIQWTDTNIQIRTTRILSNINLSLHSNESLGIIGNNGSGKTILAKAIAGLIPILGGTYCESKHLNRFYVSFQSNFELKHGVSAFRQQRWNWYDTEIIPTVKQEFSKIENQEEIARLIELFNFKKHMNLFVISLSNGEQRKFELIKALAQKPDLLVIDNAFNGLDKASRAVLHEMFDQMKVNHQSFVLTGLQPSDFPKSMNQFLSIDENGQTKQLQRENLSENVVVPKSHELELPYWKRSSFNEIININNAGFEMNGKPILHHISWTVKPGENWVLSGGNGSGKTSLLNLIFADNPKAYLQDIKLFGKQKGTGESIWDIKNKIGFVSPEMHQYLPKRQSVNDVICSGFFVSEGLYEKPSSYQRIVSKQWLKTIALEALNDCKFETLSASNQRMVLVLRALVKTPPLIILDEPFQGLDTQNIQKMKDLLNYIAEYTNSSMIFVSHFENEIPQSFNLELRLEHGEIAFSGIRKQ